jgi:hypothetical protein
MVFRMFGSRGLSGMFGSKGLSGFWIVGFSRIQDRCFSKDLRILVLFGCFWIIWLFRDSVVFVAGTKM